MNRVPFLKPSTGKIAVILSVLALSGLSLQGCTAFPQLDRASRNRTHLPIDLAPVDEILMQADAPSVAEPEAAGVTSRASSLRDRAARLRRM